MKHILLFRFEIYLYFSPQPTINMNARACLISGPPGIGKTTAAGVAARVQGLQLLEFNASDTRNKAHIEGGHEFVDMHVYVSVYLYVYIIYSYILYIYVTYRCLAGGMSRCLCIHALICGCLYSCFAASICIEVYLQTPL